MQGGVGGGGAGANEEKTEGLMDEIMKHPLFMDPSKITVGIHRFPGHGAGPSCLHACCRLKILKPMRI